jgi:hypothetical protein
MVTEIELFESPGLTPLDFYLWGWMKTEVHKRKVDTADELLGSILDAAAGLKKREDQFRRTTLHFRTRVANCFEVYGGIFEHLL